jgi:hypothetical protein
VSVGRIVDTDTRFILEIMEFQPVIEAPAPAGLTEATMYGRHTLPAKESLLRVVLTKELPAETTTFGFAEVWANFRTRLYYHQGLPWESTIFSGTRWGVGTERLQRARITLPEVLVPRQTLVRGMNCPVTGLPFVWCFLRARQPREG